MIPVEILALIFLVVASLKILVLLVKPKAWGDVVKSSWTNPILTGIVSFVFAMIVLYYLIGEITIVHIFAVMLFVSLLAAVGVSFYSKDVLKIVNKFFKDRKMLKKSWLYVLLWIVLIVWGFLFLFLV